MTSSLSPCTYTASALPRQTPGDGLSSHRMQAILSWLKGHVACAGTICAITCSFCYSSRLQPSASDHLTGHSCPRAASSMLPALVSAIYGDVIQAYIASHHVTHLQQKMKSARASQLWLRLTVSVVRSPTLASLHLKLIIILMPACAHQRLQLLRCHHGTRGQQYN